MPGPISEDLRKRVVAAYKAGEGRQADVARRFSIGLASVVRWVRLERETGTLRAKKMGGRPRIIDDEGVRVICQLVDDHPDSTLEELVQLFGDQTGQWVSCATMGRTVRRAGITRKKSPSLHSSETLIA